MVILKPPLVPPGSRFKGYEDFVVQGLIIKPHNVRYRRERWLLPDGETVVASFPDDAVPGGHFGPDLLCFILHQYHHQHVTQPLLLEQVRQLGIDISSGQLNRILTEGKDAFHQEKEELLPAGLATASYIHADDTVARHRGKQGFCTHVGNDSSPTSEAPTARAGSTSSRCRAAATGTTWSMRWPWPISPGRNWPWP